MQNIQINEIQNKAFEIMEEFDDFCKLHDIKYYLLGGSVLGAYRHQGFIPWDDDIDIGIPRADYERFVKIANLELAGKYFAKNPTNTYNCPFVFTRFEDINTTYIEASRDKDNYVGGAYIEIFPLDGASNIKLLRQFQALEVKVYKYILYAKICDIKGKKRSWIKTAIIKTVKKKIKTDTLTHVLSRTIQKYPYHKSKWICNHIGHWGLKESFTKDIFEPSLSRAFETRNLPCPNKIEKYLLQMYGSNFMIPPSDEEIKKGWHVPSYVNLKLPYREYKLIENKGELNL